MITLRPRKTLHSRLCHTVSPPRSRTFAERRTFIFGNSAVEELQALAKDEHRSRVFYQIIFTIWNWEDAARFYNQNSNPLYIEGREAVKERETLKAELTCKEDSIARLNGDIAEYRGAIKQMFDEKVDYQKEIDEKDAEIVKLKVRLYDLMTASGK